MRQRLYPTKPTLIVFSLLICLFGGYSHAQCWSVGGSTVSLYWDANSEPDMDRYHVYRSSTSGPPYSLIGTAPQGADPVSFTDTTPLSTGYYVVKALNVNLLESGFSNEVCVQIRNDPTAMDDSASTTPNVAVIIDVLSNDTDPDGDSLTVDSVTQPTNGSVVINADETLSYTPASNFIGNDSFNYTVDDGQGGTDTATVSVDVAPPPPPPPPPNNAPTAVEDNASTSEDAAVIIDVLSNDSDPDGDTLTVNAVTPPTNGSVLINGDQTVSYTPASNFNGSDSFSYTVSDGQGATDTASVTVSISAVNDVPTAVNDSAGTTPNVAVIIDVLSNDSDPDGDTVTVNAVTPPTNGSVLINADQTVSYTPASNFNGSDSFSYTVVDGQGGGDTATVTVSVSAVSIPPGLVAAYAFDEGVGTTTIDASGNGNGGTLVNGPVWVSGKYGSALSFDGIDDFVRILDADILDITGEITIEAWIFSNRFDLLYLTFLSETTTGQPTNYFLGLFNDEVDFGFYTGGWSEIVTNGVNLSLNTWTHVAATFDDAANNVRIYVNGAEVLSATQNNSMTVNAEHLIIGRSWVSESFSGRVDNVRILNKVLSPSEIIDSSNTPITPTSGPINNDPIAVTDSASTNEDVAVIIDVLSNDSDSDGDTLTLNSLTQPANGTVVINVDDTITYTPNANFNGADSFSYTVIDDNGGSATATVNATVNDNPTALDDSATTSEDTPVTIAVLGNDSDLDGDTLTVNSTTASTNGTVAINADDTITYTPNTNFNGSDSFTYTVIDGNGGSATATVNVMVNDNPTALDDSATTSEDMPVTIAVLGNDSDLDTDSLSVNATTAPANGTVVINVDDTITYTPNTNFNGSDSFTYTVIDGNGGSAIATANVTVNAGNDDPTTVDDAAVTSEDTPVTINVLANDSDLDGDTLSVNATTVPANGTVVINVDDTITYTPNANFNGADSFTYTVIDGNGGSATATVTATVNVTNNAPTAVDDIASTSEDVAVTIDVLSNDSDPDGDSVTVNAVTPPTNGSVLINGDQTVSYTPADNFNGSDSFSYTVSDGQGATDTASVTVSISAVNDAPTAVEDNASTSEDVVVIIDVLSNDEEPDGDSLTVNSVTQPPNGLVVVNADETVSYTPVSNFQGSDSFNYTVADGQGGTDTATVTVTVTGETVLVAPYMNGNSAAFNSRVYLWNPSASAGNVTVRVFTLPDIGDSLLLGAVDLGIVGASSARNIKLAEDVLTPLGIPMPYTDDDGNLTLEFTVQAPNVQGTAQVFSSSLVLGTYPLQEIPSTSNVSPTVLAAHFMNGNSAFVNSRVYLWNPSASAGEVTVRVLTLPAAGGTPQELTGTPLNLGTLGAESARNIELAEDILAPLGIPLPYTDDGGNLTLEFTIEASNVQGVAQVSSPSLAFGTYPLQ